MLSNDQKKVMSELLKSDIEISHDRDIISELQLIDQSNVKSVYIEDTVPNSSEYNQKIVITFDPNVLEDRSYYVYTERLFGGFESIDKSVEVLDNRESSGIVDCKTSLINLLNE